MNMKKIKEWVTVKNLVVICTASTAVVALWSDNMNAFLAWIWVTIYAIQDVYREDVA